jgi:hypothetical protein
MMAAYDAGIDVQVHYIPSTRSLGSLHDIHEWAERLHCSVLHIQLPVFQGRNKETQSLQVGPEYEKSLSDEVNRLPQSSHTAIHVSRFWQYRWGWLTKLGEASRSQLIVRADGAISTCNACKYLNGQALRENILISGRALADVWNDSAELAKKHNCLEDRSHEKRAKADEGCSSVHIMHTNVPLS